MLWMKARCTPMQIIMDYTQVGRGISEMTKSGFVWFCKKAPQ